MLSLFTHIRRYRHPIETPSSEELRAAEEAQRNFERRLIWEWNRAIRLTTEVWKWVKSL